MGSKRQFDPVFGTVCGIRVFAVGQIREGQRQLFKVQGERTNYPFALHRVFVTQVTSRGCYVVGDFTNS